MVENFIIRAIDEREDSFVVSSGEKNYKIRKKDLKKTELRVGDELVVVYLSGFPNVIATLHLKGRQIFNKTREKVIDEYLKGEERIFHNRLPKIAKQRVEMFSMFNEFYDKCERLYEVLALNLGYRLFLQSGTEEDINVFSKLSVADQLMMLPHFWHPIMPQTPVEIITRIAKAYMHDEAAGLLSGENVDIRKSAIMNLPNVTAKKSGKLCEPRKEYIEKYLAAKAAETDAKA